MFLTGYSFVLFKGDNVSINYVEHKCGICERYFCIDSTFDGGVDCPYCLEG
jgi:hypothetical protein